MKKKTLIAGFLGLAIGFFLSTLVRVILNSQGIELPWWQHTLYGIAVIGVIGAIFFLISKAKKDS